MTTLKQADSSDYIIVSSPDVSWQVAQQVEFLGKPFIVKELCPDKDEAVLMHGEYVGDGLIATDRCARGLHNWQNATSMHDGGNEGVKICSRCRKQEKFDVNVKQRWGD